MKNYRMYCSSVNERYIDEIVDILRQGGVIIYPTDSLYAIGCDALNNRAVERVCRLKGINPAKQHLSMVCSGISQASDFARIDNNAFRLLKANLPGPFTFILPASPRLAKAFKGRKEAGVRVPDNAIATAIAEALGNPLLSATAQPDPEVFPTPEELQDQYHNLIDAMVIAADINEDTPQRPSAVVSLADPTSPEILREGPQSLQL